MLKLMRSIVSGIARRFRRRDGSASAVRDRPLAVGLALPIVAALSGHDGVGQASNGRSMGTVRVSACSGVGARDQDGRQWIAKFVS
jgi:hypothetical protein